LHDEAVGGGEFPIRLAKKKQKKAEESLFKYESPNCGWKQHEHEEHD
jgi:hypothetical protein